MRTIWAENEFKYEGSTLLDGTCGPNALSSVESYVWQKHVTTLAVYRAMRANNWCDPNGASNATEVWHQAVKDGATAELRAYGEPWNDWYNWVVTRLKNNCAIVLNIARGQALKDTLTGKGENAKNLQYHFIALLEYHIGGWNARLNRNLPEGCIVVDGDNFATPYATTINLVEFYDIPTLAAAKPCGAIAVRYQEQGGNAMATGVPTGWSDTNISDFAGTLTAPNGVPCVRGFRHFILTYPGGWPADDVPLEKERTVTQDGTRIIQTFNYSQLRYDAASGVIKRGNIGADWLTLIGQVATLTGQVKSLQDSLSQAQQGSGQAGEALDIIKRFEKLLEEIKGGQ